MAMHVHFSDIPPKLVILQDLLLVKFFHPELQNTNTRLCSERYMWCLKKAYFHADGEY